MNQIKYQTPEEVLIRGREAIGIPLRDIDKTGRLITGRGAIGNVIEESWFGIKINRDSEPDFPQAGVELKVTPYIRTRAGEIRAKERLVCNIINYMEEYEKNFYTSSFWYKCNLMLIMSYEHLYETSKGDFKIEEAILFSFPEEDLLVIKKDWEMIMQKVREGRAHELSEGDTFYLGACTKGANSTSTRKQPCSSIPAKQRAYALKQSYMTSVLQRFIFGNEQNEKIIKNPQQLREKSLIELLNEKFAPYIGKSQEELKAILGIETSAKSLNYLIVSAILGVLDIEKIDEFLKANIKVKTIRLEADGNSIAENMSFPVFKFKDIINEEWEDSDMYQQFVEQKYLFIVFRKDNEYNFDKNNPRHTEAHLFLEKLILWQLPEEDEIEVKQVWERTVQTIRDGVQLNKVKWGKGFRIENNLPKETENRVAHVRPHAKKSEYRFDGEKIGDLPNANELPDGRWMTKQCFWFNKSYIFEQIKKHLDMTR
ncbi:MAG: Sau3AI family type II restriction endonuclease [Christensenellales bacterium]|jgi:DNA mismatch repair protein MutH